MSHHLDRLPDAVFDAPLPKKAFDGHLLFKSIKNLFKSGASSAGLIMRYTIDLERAEGHRLTQTALDSIRADNW